MMHYSNLRIAMATLPLSACIISGCSSDDCVGNKNALPLAGFYSSGADPKQVSIDSICVYGQGAPGDSMLLDTARNVSQVYLPFDIDSSSTTYVIEYVQPSLSHLNLKDEITFHYEARPFFVSSACGVSYVYDIKNIEHTSVMIDSVTCHGMKITNEDVENIHIYFRTLETE